MLLLLLLQWVKLNMDGSVLCKCNDVPEDVMKCGMVDELLVDFVEYGFLPPPPAELLLELELELELVVG